MRKLLLLLAALILSLPPSLAAGGPMVRLPGVDNNNGTSSTNGFPVTFGGQGAANIFQQNGSIPAGATTVTFTQPSTQITIVTGGTTPANLFISFTGSAATTGAGNFEIFSPGSYTYQGPPLTSISIIGASAAGNYAVCAH